METSTEATFVKRFNQDGTLSTRKHVGACLLRYPLYANTDVGFRCVRGLECLLPLLQIKTPLVRRGLLRAGGLKFAVEGEFALDLKRYQEKKREIDDPAPHRFSGLDLGNNPF
jgi:hypothetical protein